LRRKQRQEFSDPDYEKLMKFKRNRDLIRVLRLLFESIKTYQELAKRTGLSSTKIKNLVAVGEEAGYIETKPRLGGFRSRPGMKGESRLDKKTGRPEKYCMLTWKAKWLLRNDPEVRDQWSQEGVSKEWISEHNDLDSYQDLVYAIRKHPRLSKYSEPWNLMCEELQGLLLKPFVVGNRFGSRETALYDELVKIIRKNVRSDHVLPYYLVLHNSLNDITEMLECNKLLLRKMEGLSEVQVYLQKKKAGE
jgi:DNA-binding Lrp family transcriptional regulator